jgi:hypothetical protein
MNKLNDVKPQLAVMAVHRGFKLLVDGTIRFTVDIDPAFNTAFLSNFGEIDTPMAIAPMRYGKLASQVMNDAISEEGERPQGRKKTDAGRLAQALYQKYFFLSPKVCQALGTDAQYHEWVKSLPESATGRKGVPEQDPIVPAHVRRVKDGAGTSYKPPFTQIPLTKSEHDLQHQKGESAVVDGGKDQFDKWRVKYLTMWCKQRIYEIFNVSSMTELDVDEFLEWADEKGLSHLIPKDWRTQ